jgi:hypothetical protein
MTPFWNKIVKFAFCPSITHKDDNFAKKNSITIGRKINWLTRANITIQFALAAIQTRKARQSLAFLPISIARANKLYIFRQWKINWLTRANITHPVIHTVYVQSSLDFGKNALLIFNKQTCWVGDFYSASSLKQQSAGGHVISHPDADQPGQKANFTILFQNGVIKRYLKVLWFFLMFYPILMQTIFLIRLY